MHNQHPLFDWEQSLWVRGSILAALTCHLVFDVYNALASLEKQCGLRYNVDCQTHRGHHRFDIVIPKNLPPTPSSLDIYGESHSGFANHILLLPAFALP
jgi:hypothetical protein